MKKFLISCLFLLFLSSCEEEGGGLSDFAVDAIVRLLDGPSLNSCGYVLEIEESTGLLLLIPQDPLPSTYQVDNLPVSVDYSRLGASVVCDAGPSIRTIEEAIVQAIQSR